MAKGKGYDYFGCLVKMSEYALEEARQLHSIISGFSADKIEQARDSMHALEHACDLEKHAMTTALIKEFLPPVDREDLFRLAHVTDNLTDRVESVLVFFYMANITAVREDACEFTSLIIESCEKVVEMLKEFKNFKKSQTLSQIIVDLNDIEEKGDRLYESAVRRLSVESQSTREVIEWRDVYRNFENCFDAAESIADNIESVVMKNS